MIQNAKEIGKWKLQSIETGGWIPTAIYDLDHYDNKKFTKFVHEAKNINKIIWSRVKVVKVIFDET